MSGGVDILSMIDPKINIGTIVEVVLFIGGGIAGFVTLKNTVVTLKGEVGGIQNEIKKLSDIIIKQAVLDTRLAAAEQDIRDMQRGRGFIQGDRGIDHEYGRE